MKDWTTKDDNKSIIEKYNRSNLINTSTSRFSKLTFE